MQSKLIKYFREIWHLAGDDVNRLRFIFALFLLVGLLDLLGLGLIGQYFALALGAAPASPSFNVGLGSINMGVIGTALILVFALKAGLGIWANKHIFTAAGRIEAHLRVQLLQRYQAMPYQIWAARNSSDYITAINVWAPQYSRLVLIPLLRVSAEALVACLILGFLFWIDPAAFILLFTLIGGVTLLYDRILRKKNREYANQFKTLSSLLITDVRQAMDGIKEIRVLGVEKYFSDRVARNGEALCYAQSSSNTISNSSRYFLEFSVVVFAVLVPLTVSVTGGRIVDLVPVLAIFGAGAVRLVTLFSLVNTTLTQLGFNRQVVHSLYIDLNQEIPKSNSVTRSCPAQNFNCLYARKIGFSYTPSSSPILDNANFKLKRGEKLALLGMSGAGKSTLVDLLLGILQPSTGIIEVTDASGRIIKNDIAQYSVYLPQSTFILDDSVRRNVALGQDDIQIDDTRIRDALRRTKLWEVVEAMPQGTETPLGDRGLSLSGGQRQRIAIARAFYLGKTVLFLDEATNGIDTKTEDEILDDLLSSSDDLTIVFITHRTDIVHRFNRICRVEHGQVCEVTGEFRRNVPSI